MDKIKQSDDAVDSLICVEYIVDELAKNGIKIDGSIEIVEGANSTRGGCSYAFFFFYGRPGRMRGAAIQHDFRRDSIGVYFDSANIELNLSDVKIIDKIIKFWAEQSNITFGSQGQID